MPFQGQWADTILAFERVHLLRLLIWAAASIFAGTSLLTWSRVRRAESPLLSHFAIQNVAWGVVILLFAAASTRGLELRDLAAATALDRAAWFSSGLSVGCVALGVVLAGAGWRIGRRLEPVGAGLGIVVQGLALLVLHLQFAAALAR